MFDLDALIDKATRQAPKKKPARKKKPVPAEVAVQQIIEQAVGSQKKLRCGGEAGCSSAVTRIDTKGFVYCPTHGRVGYGGRRSRKLTKAEIKTLEAGGAISYRRKKKPVPAEVAVQQIIEQATAPVAVQQIDGGASAAGGWCSGGGHWRDCTIEQASLRIIRAVAVQQLIEQAVAQQQGAVPQGFTALIEGIPFTTRLLHSTSLTTTYQAAKIIGRGKIRYSGSDGAYVVVGQTSKGGFDVLVFKDDEPGWTVFYTKIPSADDAVTLATNFYKDRKRQARKLDEPFRRRMAKYQARGQKQGQLGLL